MNLQSEVQSLGGTGYGLGSDGFSNNPLMWLITLGFLSRNGGLLGGGGGEVASAASIANSAKIDCLQQGQTALADRIASQSDEFRFQNMTTNINNLADIERATQDTIFRETAAVQRQLAECCCEIKEGIQGVNTAIALQTNTLTMNANANTQKILDALCNNQIEALRTDNNNLRSNLNKAEIIAAITAECGGNGAARGVARA